MKGSTFIDSLYPITSLVFFDSGPFPMIVFEYHNALDDVRILLL